MFEHMRCVQLLQYLLDKSLCRQLGLPVSFVLIAVFFDMMWTADIIILRIRAKKSEFSKRTYRLHINVVVAITLYCLILFLQLGLPVAIFVIVVFFDVMWIMSIACFSPYFELLLFVPICLFSMSTCLMYLAVIRTFRLAVIQMAKRIFNIRKHYAPSNTCSGQDILRRTQIPSHSR
ncbi:hypothetical protein ANCCAN_10641 [Ancylostoma caninum]|uniref:G-protein coupled receptors family 1 profile domain-containing protein n=1 Tax=Ancylostoma caninum TaxID=29170 RepID=A0A368GKG6_ANCCA|nr:hypothetical protein ANCCAN_10641 [Ancylostoma caninum]